MQGYMWGLQCRGTCGQREFRGILVDTRISYHSYKKDNMGLVLHSQETRALHFGGLGL